MSNRDDSVRAIDQLQADYAQRVGASWLADHAFQRLPAEGHGLATGETPNDSRLVPWLSYDGLRGLRLPVYLCVLGDQVTGLFAGTDLGVELPTADLRAALEYVAFAAQAHGEVFPFEHPDLLERYAALPGAATYGLTESSEAHASDPAYNALLTAYRVFKPAPPSILSLLFRRHAGHYVLFPTERSLRIDAAAWAAVLFAPGMTPSALPDTALHSIDPDQPAPFGPLDLSDPSAGANYQRLLQALQAEGRHLDALTLAENTLRASAFRAYDTATLRQQVADLARTAVPGTLEHAMAIIKATDRHPA